MKKYSSIARYGKSFTLGALEKGFMVVWEKIDGANASFKKVDGILRTFSRNNELEGDSGLRGFREWALMHINLDTIEEGKIYFGEWSCRHKLDYGANENKFYLFDLFDESTERYSHYDEVVAAADKAGLRLAPVFYKGPAIPYEDIVQFVGKSFIGEIGEGVVVKNYDYDYKGSQVWVKIVSEQFQEWNGAKVKKVNASGDAITEFVKSALTEARVEKLLDKLVDEGVIPPDYDVTDMGKILKATGSRLYDDIIDEELSELLRVVKSRIGRAAPSIIKQVIENKAQA